jgi:glycosyltransferase involved in cell wall biosynthesis
MIEASGCMIVQNEEKTIAKAIQSIREYVDDLVVLDGGSTDGTVEIAKSLGCTVHTFPFDMDFAAQRNRATAFCKHDWVVWVDADEWYSAELCKHLPAIVEHGAESIVGVYRVLRVDVIDGKVWAVEMQDRIINRARARWKGAVHEWLVPAQAGERITLTVLAPQLFICHEHSMKRQVYNNKLYQNIKTGKMERPGPTEGAEYHDASETWVDVPTDRDA